MPSQSPVTGLVAQANAEWPRIQGDGWKFLAIAPGLTEKIVAVYGPLA